MTNANNAKLVRIMTRALDANVPNEIPLTTDGGNQFSIVVEGTAGSVLSASGQPYVLKIAALDITAGTNPHSEANTFTQRKLERFDAAHGWPNKIATFTITLNDLRAVRGHLFRYYAILMSANRIISFVESPLFLLDADLPNLDASSGGPWALLTGFFSNPMGIAMNGNDARIIRLFTAQAGSLVEDNTPNANSPISNQFDLILQAEAGSILGNSGANYTLTLYAINDDTVVPEVNLNPTGNPFKEQWNLADGWKRTGNDFVKTGAGESDGVMRYEITIPPDLTGAFHYNARLVSDNFQITSFIQSNPFIIV
jgi:hypothetical protein